jgi:hypothetical protein
MLVSCLSYSSTQRWKRHVPLKRPLTSTTTRRCIPEERTLRNHRYENLKFYTGKKLVVLMELQGSLPCLIKLIIGLLPQLNSVQILTPDVRKITFNIVLPVTFKAPE